ncbi:MAG: carboxypeptidase-like regulatory domain-containing protein [Candidatus Woesearchaeota archaeon]
MKKGYDVFSVPSIVITILLIATVTTVIVYGYDCMGEFSDTPCVCGHMPNSTLGYGQVIIGGGLNYSCDNTADDSICPEDYQDAASGIIGNCSNCPDIDCIAANLSGEGYIWGYVRDSNGYPIDKVEIVGSPSKWNESASLERSTTTQYSGGEILYNYSGFLTGRYSFKVSKSGYDTAIVPVTVTRGMIQQVNFTLQNGTCHGDCTNSYGRCNKNCQGLSFDNSTNNCTYVSAEAMDACNNFEDGCSVKIRDHNSTHSVYVDCCEGTPYYKYNMKVDTDYNPNIKNMVKVEKIVRNCYEPSRLVIAYWR